jgi:UDP-N-acetylglucosamine--N-acetylmuramyl-(pentapeptide) pyrophosphoryl-undecaprenol N-acetylglucosamine transferase
VKVVIAGGGTAGHVTPGIALADALRRRHGADVVFVGSATGPEARMVPEAGIAFHGIEAAPLYRELSVRAARAPFVALRSMRDCRPVVRGADAVVGVGGYASVPAGLAAYRERIPLVLHEQNAVPSLANRLLARGAAAVASTFVGARQRFPRGVRFVHTGDPVRARILEVRSRRRELAAEARAAFDLEEGVATVLVFGGSQGALRLDEALAGALPRLADEPVQILALTGRDHAAVVAEPAARGPAPRIHVEPFLDRMELAYAVADLAVARAGAGTIAELAVCGIPAVLVPYPHATADHQTANARELVRAGAADLVPDRDLSSERLAGCILDGVRDESRRDRMAQAMRTWSRPDADERLAALVREVARR